MSEIVDSLLNQWSQFKAENDARIKEVEKFGSASAETNTKVDRIGDSLDRVQTQLVEVENRLNRPQIGPGHPGTEAEVANGFRAWLHTGIKNAAMQEGTTTEGGYTVPTPMATEIMTGLQTASIMRAIGAPVKQMTNWKMDWPTLTNSTAAIQTAEEGAVSEVEPTVGTVPVVAYAFTRLAKVSKELVADGAYDVWGNILSPDYIQAFAKAENAAFTTGDGSGHPQGVVTGATAAVTAASATVPTADELIDLFYSLDYRHQPNAKWMMANSTVKIVRKMKDGEGQYLWAPGFAGAPQSILGQPLIKNDDMPAATAGLKAIVVGDFAYFFIFDRQGMEIQRLNELYAGNRQIGFLADKRFDSHVMMATAFQLLTMHA